MRFVVPEMVIAESGISAANNQPVSSSAQLTAEDKVRIMSNSVQWQYKDKPVFLLTGSVDYAVLSVAVEPDSEKGSKIREGKQ